MKIVRIFVCMLLISTVLSASGNVSVRKTSNPLSNGNIFYVGGTGPGNYTSIQDAIDNASDGDTVFVYDDSSPYYENIVINKNISLIGEDRNSTIIDANGTSHNILIESDTVSIHEFTLQNPNRYGIFNIGFGFCSFSDNIINNTFVGILMSGACKNTIEGNTFFDYELCGIDLHGCDSNMISGNSFSNHPGNKHNWGISFGKSSRNEISYNTFNENMIGIGFGSYSHYNLILNNSIRFNSEYGIGISEGSNNTIVGNIISHCADYGIKIVETDFKNNIIFHNNFKFNGKNANDIGNNTWDDGYPSGGNYWDDYTGSDNDSDGIGDTPYLIPGGDNEDRYPLMYPWGEPEVPTIEGATTGKPGTPYTYTFTSIDPDGDQVSYYIYWGDGDITNWADFQSSGEPYSESHIWATKGTYTISAKAKDIYGFESEWGELQVTMPRDKATNNVLFLRLLERFPLLQKLLFSL